MVVQGLRCEVVEGAFEVDVLCFALSPKDGWRLKVTLSKTSASTSALDSACTMTTFIVHCRNGNPSMPLSLSSL